MRTVLGSKFLYDCTVVVCLYLIIFIEVPLTKIYFQLLDYAHFEFGLSEEVCARAYAK